MPTTLKYTTTPHPEYHNCDLLEITCPLCGGHLNTFVGKDNAAWSRREAVQRILSTHIEYFEQPSWIIPEPDNNTELCFYEPANIVMRRGPATVEVLTAADIAAEADMRQCLIADIVRDMDALKEVLDDGTYQARVG